MKVDPVGKKARVVFGDESGTVRGFIFNDECVKEGNTVVLFRAEAAVVKEHIEIQIPKGGKIDESKNRKVQEVNEEIDISEKAWIESA